jgi:hypothetical protein
MDPPNKKHRQALCITNNIYMNYFKLFFLSLICLIFSKDLVAQRGINRKKIRSTSTDTSWYQNKWNYLSFKDPIEMIIIEHTLAGVGCGSLATASETIGRVGNDTIRVLMLCNTDKIFIKDQTVMVYPYDRPNFFVSLPIEIHTGPADKMHPRYGLTVLKTTYGNIVAR